MQTNMIHGTPNEIQSKLDVKVIKKRRPVVGPDSKANNGFCDS